MEFHSTYLYLAMSAYFESIGLRRLANWMRCQALEELVHRMKFYNFLNERNGTVILTSVAGVPEKWDSPPNAFEETYHHEQEVTGLINGLVDLALQEKDHASSTFLQWFVAEQVEEEASADDDVQKLRLVGNDGGGLFMIDLELAGRTFTMPAAKGGKSEKESGKK
jgi:ferritin